MRKNVLIADDDPLMCDLLKFFLEQSGFVPIVCQDGYSALQELKSNPIDVVILDISMPHLNGQKTLRAIRADPATKDIPVIMLTGSQDKNDVVTAKQNKITDYLIKPPAREDFIKRVELALNGRPQFVEITMVEGDPSADGDLELPFKLKSASQNGLVLSGDVPLPPGKNINIKRLRCLEAIA